MLQEKLSKPKMKQGKPSNLQMQMEGLSTLMRIVADEIEHRPVRSEKRPARNLVPQKVEEEKSGR